MYNRTFWQDHVTEYDNRFREQNNADGTISHIPVEGEIIQEGTPQNATNFNNIEAGIFDAHEINSELARVAVQHENNINALKGEIGTVTLENGSIYPFNSSVQTVALVTPRDTTNYMVDTYIVSPADNGNIGRIVVSDKLTNGFKIAYTGSASSATIKYIVRGGAV